MNIEREILCRGALAGGGWVEPARLRIAPDGTIESVEAVRSEDTAGALAGFIVPGMPNLHSHAFQRQMAGLAEHGGGRPDTFWTWREAMYRLAARVNPAQLQAIAAWVQAEMLEAGFTSCAEFHYLHHRPGGAPYPELAEMAHRLLAAASSSGIALTLLPVLYCRSGFGAAGVERHQRRFANDPARFGDLVAACREAVAGHPLQRVGIAPHSLRAVSRGDLRAVFDDPENAAGPVHIHVAEQRAEVDDCRSALGAPPTAWLLRHFDVGPNWCLVHATHLDADERQSAAASGAVAGLCPTTEADLGDGCFDTEAWRAAGGRFGIGSDSNLRVSVTGELRALEFQARLRGLQRIVLAEPGRSCGRSLYDRAARDGAQALAQPVGRIEAGLRADLIELDAGHPLLCGRSGDAVLDTWIFAGGRDMVRSVWVGGQRQVRDGRHRHREPLAADFRKAMEELG